MSDSLPEEWRAIPGLEGEYEASSHGRVRSLDRHIKRPNGMARVKGRILRQATTWKGYKRVEVKGRGYQAHRLICAAFHGPPEPGQVTMHLNDVRDDNRPENLRWGSWKDNQVDAVNKGRQSMIVKTHCPRGHPYDEENTYFTPKGHRKCLKCAKILAKRMSDKGLPTGDTRHGTTNGYGNYGCRCDKCKQAKREDRRRYIERNLHGQASAESL